MPIVADPCANGLPSGGDREERVCDVSERRAIQPEMTSASLHAVTGAFGYSGRYLTAHLLDEGRQVITLTHSTGEGPIRWRTGCGRSLSRSTNRRS